MDRPVLYLDTGHLSRLAKTPEQYSPILDILRDGKIYLAFSLLHLHELSAPGPWGREMVGGLLDSVPLAWSIWIDDVFDREAHSALARALTDSYTPPTVFFLDSGSAWGVPENARITPSQMLNNLANNAKLRTAVPAVADRGARLDQLLKQNAAVVKHPNGPLLGRLRDMRISQTPGGLHLPHPYPAEEIVRRVGGIAAFPAYNVFQALALTRLRDNRFSTKPNDLIDEWHACYSPYASLTALDRGTAARCRSAKIPGVERITETPEGLVELVKTLA